MSFVFIYSDLENLSYRPRRSLRYKDTISILQSCAVSKRRNKNALKGKDDNLVKEWKHDVPWLLTWVER